MRRDWTEREVRTLRELFPTTPAADVARKLGRSLNAVYQKAWKLGLQGRPVATEWTPRMLKMMEDFFPIMFNDALARWLGVSETSMHRKAREMGLTKRPGFLVDRRPEITERAADALRRVPCATRFKPGQRGNPATEFRPGHKMTPEEKAKSQETRRRNAERKRRRDELKHYGIGVNR